MSKKVENGLLFIWIVSVVATLGSLYFSEIRHYEPCKMCWIQRIFMYPIVIMTTIAFIQKMHVLQLQQLFLPLWVAVYLFIITEFKSLVFSRYRSFLWSCFLYWSIY